jgi:hypothetical protein
MYNYIEIPKKYKGKIICKDCFNNKCQEDEISSNFFVSYEEMKGVEWTCNECSKMFIIPEKFKSLMLSENDTDHILPAIIGEEGCTFSWQEPFPNKTKCHCCGGTSRLGFVVHEGFESEFPLSHLYQSEAEEGYWFHDVCAVAVYFCKECFEGTVIHNQA